MLASATPVPAQSFEISIPAADGTLLATDVYLPFGGGPWPTVLIRTPYDKDGMGQVCLGLTLLQYTCVAQDTRGRFDSGGEDTVFRDDAEDGRVTVEWVADQPWCDGHIGMFGGSAFAIPQYLLAPGADPALRSIAPVVATPDLYHHAFLQGGAIREELTVNWLESQGASAFYDEIRQHRLKDAWWDPVEVLASAGSVHAAGLHVGGWYDIFGQGTLDGFSAFQERGGSGATGRQFLVMGPWTHNDLFSRQAGALTYPANAALDPIDLLLPWYEATLRDEPSAIEDWPVVRAYVMGAVGEPGAPGNVWVGLDRWPPRAATRELFLTADGELESTAPGEGELPLVSDPDHPVYTLGGANLSPDLIVDGRPMGDGPQDQRPIEARDDVAVFDDRAAERAAARGRSGALRAVVGARHGRPRPRGPADRRLPGRTLDAGARRPAAGADALRRRPRVPADARGPGRGDGRAVVDRDRVQRRPPHPHRGVRQQLAALRGQPERRRRPQHPDLAGGRASGAAVRARPPVAARAAGADALRRVAGRLQPAAPFVLEPWQARGTTINATIGARWIGSSRP